MISKSWTRKMAVLPPIFSFSGVLKKGGEGEETKMRWSDDDDMRLSNE